MPKVFFISYARDRSAGPHPQGLESRFEEALSKEVSEQLPHDNERAGFRDTCSIEAGTANWATELETQLIAYPIGIVLLSPAYLDQARPWCKWEFDYLESRNSAVSSTLSPPRLLLILMWERPDDKDIPKEFPLQVQHVTESIAGSDKQAAFAVQHVLYLGLRKAMQLVDSKDDRVLPLYTRFLQVFAKYVVAQWRRWTEIPPNLVNIPLPAPFDPNNRWAPAKPTSVAPPQPRPDRAQRRRVFVVYIAAPPSEVSACREWRYREDGGYDWKPFAVTDQVGDGRHVGDFVKELGEVEVIPWPFTYFYEHMEEALGKAGRRYPVLLIVDPWTTCQLDRYRKALEYYVKSFDDRLFCSPIVIWNENDSDTFGIRSDFEQKVGSLFNQNRWEPVAEGSEFTDTLDGVIRLLQRKIRNVLADENSRGGSNPPRISAL